MDKIRKRSGDDPAFGTTIAVEALSHLASDPVLLKRFLDLSGLEPHEIRAASADPAFFVNLLDFFLADERSLLGLAAAAGIAPERVAAARASLGQERAEHFE